MKCGCAPKTCAIEFDKKHASEVPKVRVKLEAAGLEHVGTKTYEAERYGVEMRFRRRAG